MNLSRRTFLKGSALAAATGGVLGSGAYLQGYISPADAVETIEEKTAFTYHPPDCGGRCSFECLVRDGKLVRIQPNQNWNDDAWKTCCVRGLSEVQTIYSANRIQAPMKRTGDRGSNQFEQISWDQALDEIADKIKTSIDANGADSVLWSPGFSSYTYSRIATLLGSQMTGGAGIDTGIANGIDPVIGDAGGYAIISNEVRGWDATHNVFMFSKNFCESNMTTTRLLWDALEKGGGKLWVIDPMLSTTASKADRWITINPGTDPAMMLAMITAIIDNNWYDADFMARNTSAPFLVDVETGKQVSAGHIDEEAPELTDIVYYVWDRNSQSVQPFNAEGIDPAIEGDYSYNGRTVRTVFSLLKESQESYTLDWAAGITSVPAEAIEEVARVYATDGPNVLCAGFGGMDKTANSDIMGHCMGILAGLTGNIGKRGTAVGVLDGPGSQAGGAAELGAFALPEQFELAETQYELRDIAAVDDAKARVAINIGNSFEQQTANFNETTEWLKSLDTVVSICPYYNESTKWSDYILPAATCFENEYEYGQMINTRNHLVLQQKVIDPLYDAKTDFQIEHELAQRFDLDQYLPETPMDLVRAQLDTDDEMVAGITLESIAEHGGVQPLNCDYSPQTYHTDQVYTTPSTKIEFYVDDWTDYGQALPTWEAPDEIDADSDLASKYPLQFATTHSRFHCHSQFMESAWMHEIDGGPKLEMAPEDAEARGISAGDIVTVENDRGSIKVEAKINNSMRPGVTRLHEGWYSEYMPDTSACLQTLTNSVREERQKAMLYGTVIAYNDTRVEVKKA